MDIDAKTIKDLRDRSGAAVMDCKRALEEAKGDIPAAEAILKKKGVAMAGAKADRATKEGRILSYIHTTGKIGVLVEVNCETDFVAKNEEFQALHKDLAVAVCGFAPEVVAPSDLPKELVEEEKKKYEADIKGKPPQIAEKILEGKLEKNLFSQKCLLNIPYPKEEEFKGTYGDLIKAKIAKFGENITVRRFVRFEVGR